MSKLDDFKNSDRPAGDPLLDELESIKGVLANDTAEAGNELAGRAVPLLDDMVIAGLDANSRLLNLDRIFEDDFEEDVGEGIREHMATATADGELVSINQREALIQELIDEFIPRIEATLRERLIRIDTRTLQGWKDRK